MGGMEERNESELSFPPTDPSICTYGRYFNRHSDCAELYTIIQDCEDSGGSFLARRFCHALKVSAITIQQAMNGTTTFGPIAVTAESPRRYPSPAHKLSQTMSAITEYTRNGRNGICRIPAAVEVSVAKLGCQYVRSMARGPYVASCPCALSSAS